MKNKIIYALGFFDGVHLGHQALLAECCRLAKEQGALPAVVSFDTSPSAVLQGNSPRMINTNADRIRLLEQFGIKNVFLYKTNRETLAMPWHAFLAQLLETGAVGFVCGSDYRFGRDGEGCAQILQQFCREKNLPCVIVPEQQMDGEKISSSRIRALLEQGDVIQANRLLGHPHVLTGPVVSGQQLGRTIGIPTANLLLPQELLIPRFGVYACKATVEDAVYMAVTNIGTRPTVAGTGITVEAFLLDFDKDLYGKQLQLEFYQFLRPEKRFSSLAELKAEILENVRQTRKIFEKT